MWGFGALRAAVPQSQKQVDGACNNGISHIKLDIDASAVNGNKLMSHPQFYGGLLLTSVACGSARLLNYLLCPLSSRHSFCFLTMKIKKSLWGCRNRQRWKDEKESCHGDEKKCWDKGDKDVSWGRNEIKKNHLQQQAVAAVPPWSWPPFEEMEEECRLKGKDLEIGLWLQSSEETSFWELLCS